MPRGFDPGHPGGPGRPGGPHSPNGPQPPHAGGPNQHAPDGHHPHQNDPNPKPDHDPNNPDSTPDRDPLPPDQVNGQHADPTPSGTSYHRGDPEMGDLPHRVQPDPDGRYTVDVHVTPDGHARIGGRDYTPEEFADILRRNGDYDGRPIRLIGCDAGSNDFARRLSRELDTPVLAPDRPAWTDGNGRVFSSDYEIGPDGRVQPRIPPNGEWSVHNPDGTTTRAGDDGFSPDTPDADKHDLDPNDARARGDSDDGNDGTDGTDGTSHDNTGKAADIYEDIAASKKILDDHPELRGEYQWRLDALENDLREARELGNDPDAAEILDELHDDVRDINEELVGRTPGAETVETPAYVREDRVPMDHETVLADSDNYQDTGRIKKGAKIYRGADGRYYHRDTFHTGEGAEIEVYDGSYNHLGTMSPSGEFDPSTRVKGRTIRDEMQ